MFSSKLKRKLLQFTAGIAVVAVMSVGVVAPTSAAELSNPFTDVKKLNSHYDAIVSLYNDGIVTGVSKNEYQPNAAATRGDAALFLANALGLDTKNVKNPGFKDVPKTSDYYGAIAALYEDGIIGGYGDTFKPANKLTRAQFAKMLTLGFDLELANKVSTKFTDVNRLTDLDTKLYIQTLVDHEIAFGTTSTTFGPNAHLTRAQIATFLYRTLDTAENDFDIITVE